MGIALCRVVPRRPEIEVHVHVVAQRVIEIEKQAFPCITGIRLQVPRDVCVCKAAICAG